MTNLHFFVKVQVPFELNFSCVVLRWVLTNEIIYVIQYAKFSSYKYARYISVTFNVFVTSTQLYLFRRKKS